MTARRLLAAGALTAALMLHQPVTAASSVDGTCLLEVAGRSFIDGPCEIDLEPDGSFMITAYRAGEITYFAYVSLDGANLATGYWNEEIGAGHAHSPLGTLTRSGACWQNSNAKVCGWR
jgi:hypothetical protein